MEKRKKASEGNVAVYFVRNIDFLPPWCNRYSFTSIFWNFSWKTLADRAILYKTKPLKILPLPCVYIKTNNKRKITSFFLNLQLFFFYDKSIYRLLLLKEKKFSLALRRIIAILLLLLQQFEIRANLVKEFLSLNKRGLRYPLYLVHLSRNLHRFVHSWCFM